MRNLKRVLSMALASVMVLGLTVVGASAADFNDQAEIKNTTAAAVMNAIGVLEGNEKGDFMPDQVLTREQAAKIITYMLMGPENAEKLGVSGTKFSDVAADRWSAPYVAYCANMGILAGDGTGKFNPEGELTGHAFAKMLLVALGYDANIQNYVGNSWSINVATDAVNAGIYVNGTTMSNPMTRDEAAQMAFQTLTADMVKYENKGSIIELPGGGQIVANPSSATKVPAAKESSKDTYVGYKTENNDEYKQFCEQYFTDLKKDVDRSVVDGLGRQAATWTYDGDKITTVTNSADKTVVVDDSYASYTKAVQELLDKSDAKVGSVKVNGADAEADDTPSLGEVLYLYETSTKGTYNVRAARYEFAVVDKIDTDVSSTEEKAGVKALITLDKNDNAKDEIRDTDFAGFAYEKGDTIAVALNGKGDEVLDSYAVESVEGTVTARDTKANTVRLDGTKYELTAGLKASDIALNESCTLYLDANGYAIYAEGKDAVASLDNVYYIAGIRPDPNSYSTTYYAQTVALDGTVQEVKLGDVDTNKDGVLNGSDNLDDSYRNLKGLFTLKKDGSSYNAIALQDTDDYSSFKADEKEIKSSTNTLNKSTTDKAYLTKKTTYVVITGSKADDLTVKTYTGSANVKFADGSATVISNAAKDEKTGDALYVVVVADKTTATVDKHNILFLDSVGEEVVVDGETGYYAATAYDMDGKKMDIVVDSSSYGSDKLYNYSVDDNDVYTLDGSGLTSTNMDEDSKGYAIGTVTEVYNNRRVTIDRKDCDASAAQIIDARSDFKAPYDKEIYNLHRLADATTKGTVSAIMYADGPATVIFVTDVKATQSSDASCTVELASEVATIGGNATDGYTMAVSAAEETATLTITPAAKATVKSVESSATGNVTVEGSGNSWTLTAKANGESTITVKVQAEDGSQKDTTFKVTVSGIA